MTTCKTLHVFHNDGSSLCLSRSIFRCTVTHDGRTDAFSRIDSTAWSRPITTSVQDSVVCMLGTWVVFSAYYVGWCRYSSFVHLAPPLSNLPKIFGVRKLTVPGLTCGVVCVILRLAVLAEHRLVTDRQTQTDMDKQSATTLVCFTDHVTWNRTTNWLIDWLIDCTIDLMAFTLAVRSASCAMLSRHFCSS